MEAAGEGGTSSGWSSAMAYRRGSGAGPGGRTSCSPTFSPARICPRVTNHTAAVHVGKRSAPGMSSAASEGKKAQCHPSNRISKKATNKSSAESAGEAPPSTNKGNAKICSASAPIATSHANRCSGLSDLKYSRNDIVVPYPIRCPNPRTCFGLASSPL